MLKRGLLVLGALVLALPATARAQGSANFSGTWTLQKADPPVETGRGGGGGRGAAAGYGEETFSPAPQRLVITQSASQVTVQIGTAKAVYTLDGKVTEAPPGDIEALKTWTNWEGAKLHLHFKEGMNFGRDILSLSGGTLTVVRDLESGGGSTTRTLTYAKATS